MTGLKKARSSKTLWANFLAAILVKYPPIASFVASNPDIAIQGLALLNGLLRVNTKTSIVFKKEKMNLILCAFLLFSAGCSTVNQKTEIESVYQREMSLDINGKKCKGTCVAELAPKYVIKIESIGQIDYFTADTCNRHETFEDKDDAFTYGFIPLLGAEDTGSPEIVACPLELTALDKKKGKNSYAYIDFKNPFWSLKASMLCNGKKMEADGVSICQSKTGLRQVIEFLEPVTVKPSIGCEFDSKKESKLTGTRFEIELTKGVCAYNFFNDKGRFKLSTIGTDDKILGEL